MLQPSNRPNHNQHHEVKTAPSVHPSVESPPQQEDKLAFFSARIAEAKEKVFGIIKNPNQVKELRSMLTATLRNTISQALQFLSTAKPIILPVALASTLTLHNVASAVASFTNHPAIAVVFGVMAIGTTSLAVWTVRQRRALNSPERIVDHSLRSINALSSSLRSNYYSTICGIRDVVTTTSDAKNFLTSTAKEDTAKKVQFHQDYCKAVRIQIETAANVAAGKSNDIHATVVGIYAGAVLPVLDLLDKYLEIRSYLLATSAPTYRHYDLNEVVTEFTALLDELQKILPNFRFNKQDHPDLKNENYNIPTTFQALMGRVTTKKTGQETSLPR